MSQKRESSSPVRTVGKRNTQQTRARGMATLFLTWLQKLGKFLGTLALLSAAVILLFRFVPPPVSAFMVGRYVSGIFEKGSGKGIQYHWVPLPSISPHVALAAVAAEDQKFPDHWGFDFQSIVSALEEGERRGRYRGASTITQQVAKNLFLWNGRSFIRKGLEAYITVWMEILWSKKRILETYLNIAEFGDGIYGVHAAGEVFFKKHPSELGKREAAMLAAVLPNPEKFRVRAPTAYVLKRSRRIEQQMKNLGDAYLRDLMR